MFFGLRVDSIIYSFLLLFLYYSYVLFLCLSIFLFNSLASPKQERIDQRKGKKKNTWVRVPISNFPHDQDQLITCNQPLFNDKFPKITQYNDQNFILVYETGILGKNQVPMIHPGSLVDTAWDSQSQGCGFVPCWASLSWGGFFLWDPSSQSSDSWGLQYIYKYLAHPILFHD